MDLWPLVPNWVSGLKETYEFKTEILTSRSGKEQRAALRNTPRRQIAYSSLVNGEGLRRMEGILARGQERLMWGADFVRGVKTTSALPVSANTVSVRSVPTWLVPGATVCLSYRRAARRMTVAAVSGLSVTFTTGVEVPFGAGSRISRTVAGYIDSSLSTTRVTGTVAVVNSSFDIDPGTEPTDEGMINPSRWYDGREMFLYRPNWARSPSITYSRDIETVDYGVGRVARFAPVPFATVTRQATYLGRTVAETDEVRRFFARMKGMRGEFYLPSWGDDLDVTQDVAGMAPFIRVAGRQVFDDFANDRSRRSIMMVMEDGSTIAFKLHAITLDGNTSLLHLVGGFPFDLPRSLIRMVCWLQLSRFAADTLNIEWVSDGVAQFTLPIRSLEYAAPEPIDMTPWDELSLYMLSTFGWDFTENVLFDPLAWAVNVRYPDIAEI